MSEIAYMDILECIIAVHILPNIHQPDIKPTRIPGVECQYHSILLIVLCSEHLLCSIISIKLLSRALVLRRSSGRGDTRARDNNHDPMFHTTNCNLLCYGRPWYYYFLVGNILQAENLR